MARQAPMVGLGVAIRRFRSATRLKAGLVSLTVPLTFVELNARCRDILPATLTAAETKDRSAILACLEKILEPSSGKSTETPLHKSSIETSPIPPLSKPEPAPLPKQKRSNDYGAYRGTWPSLEPAGKRVHRHRNRVDLEINEADDKPFPQPGPTGRRYRILQPRRSVKIQAEVELLREDTSVEEGWDGSQPIFVDCNALDYRADQAVTAELLNDTLETQSWIKNREHARNARDALSRQNQDLPTQWAYPSQTDLKWLFHYLKPSLFEESDATESDMTNLKRDQCAAILITLFTGRLWYDISLTSRKEYRKSVMISPDVPYITFYPELPSARANRPKDSEACFDPSAEFIDCPMPPDLQQALRNLVGDWTEIREVNVSEITRWLKQINNRHGTRISLATIRNALTGALLRTGNDVTEISLLTDSSHLSQHAGLYYYSPKCTDLAARYEAAIRWMRPPLGTTERWPLVPSNCHRIGSDLYPAVGSISALVKTLEKRINTLGRRTRSPDSVRKLHNTYTAYVSLLMSFGTGCRPVGEPLARWSDVDLIRGWVLFSDKDQWQKQSTRLVPLASMVKATLTYYRTHVKSVLLRLFGNAVIKISHGNPVPQGLSPIVRTRLIFGADTVRKCSGDAPTLFYLDPDLTPIPDSAETRRPYLGAYGDLPDNVSRHWFRTAVREHGASGEWVDAAMGHWMLGQNPSGPASTMCFRDMAELLAPCIEKALVSAGFKELRGCG
jgi:integrase